MPGDPPCASPSFEQCIELGRLAIVEARLDQARAHFESAQTLRPSNLQVAVKLADVLCQLDQPAQAEKLLLATATDHPLAARPRLQLARLLDARGDVSAALEHARTASSIARHDQQATLLCSDLLIKLGQLQEAGQLMANPLLADGKVAATHFRIARIYLEREQFDPALESLHAALLVKPAHLQAGLLRGAILVLKSRPEEAIRQYITSAELNPDAVPPRLRLTRLYLQERRPDDALTYVAQARVLAPEERDIAMLAARVYCDLGRYADAVEALGQFYKVLSGELCRRLSTFGRDGYQPGAPSSGIPDIFPMWLIKLILQSDFKLLDGGQSRDYFDQHFSPAAFSTDGNWFFQLKNAGAQLDQPMPQNLSNHMEDICLMLQERRPRIYNPLTGELSDTVLSLLPDLLVLRDTAENVFVSLAPRLISSKTLESTYIFPDRKIVLHLRGPGDDTVFYLITADLEKICNNYQNLAEHASAVTASQGITLADRPIDHLGHYVWNRLSSWATVYQTGLHKRADRLVCWQKGDYFGTPDELYPELLENGLEKLEIPDLDSATEFIIASKTFWLPMYDGYVRSGLADRIVSYCSARVDDDFAARVAALRQTGGPLILLTIRLGNRAWINQQHGYICIIKELVRVFPGAAFVLDGMNQANSLSSTHKSMDITSEQAVAENIVTALDPAIPVLNTIGMPIANSIYVCNSIDAFIAAWGTAMTKYKWITNKPGVAFAAGMPAGMEDYDIAIRVFDGFRDNAIPAIDIPADCIIDAGPGNLDEPHRRNFDLPWQVVFEATCTLLGELGFESTAPRRQPLNR